MGKLREVSPERESSPETIAETAIQGRRVRVMRSNGEVYFLFDRDFSESDEDEILAAFGSQDRDLVFGLLEQLARVTLDRQFPDVRAFTLAPSQLSGISPRDSTEATIGAQMAVIHTAVMMSAARLAQAENSIEMESADRTLNRLSRTHTLLVETLGRHRNGQEQKVSIQNVSVSEGGQAIVGQINQRDKK